MSFRELWGCEMREHNADEGTRYILSSLTNFTVLVNIKKNILLLLKTIDIETIND